MWDISSLLASICSISGKRINIGWTSVDVGAISALRGAAVGIHRAYVVTEFEVTSTVCRESNSVGRRTDTDRCRPAGLQFRAEMPSASGRQRPTADRILSARCRADVSMFIGKEAGPSNYLGMPTSGRDDYPIEWSQIKVFSRMYVHIRLTYRRQATNITIRHSDCQQNQWWVKISSNSSNGRRE